VDGNANGCLFSQSVMTEYALQIGGRFMIAWRDSNDVYEDSLIWTFVGGMDLVHP
jgi:hypothetical protein